MAASAADIISRERMKDRDMILLLVLNLAGFDFPYLARAANIPG
jgi:hypothetical protein